MWQNLRNVRSMAEKIGNVVAPVQDGDEYYDDDEEGDEYYSEEEEEEEFEEEEIEEPQPPRSPFGIVGMFARAMDTEQEAYEEEHGVPADEEETEEEEAQDPLEPIESDPIEEPHVLKDYPEQHQTDRNTDVVNDAELPSEPQHHPPVVAVPQLPLTVSGGPKPSATAEPLHPESPQDLPKRLGLQRESGSLSPNKTFVSLSQTAPPLVVGGGLTTEFTDKIPPTEPVEVVKQVTPDAPKELTHDAPKEITHDIPNEVTHDAPKGLTYDGQSSHLDATENPPVDVAAPSAERSRSTTSIESSSRTERLEKRCKELNRKLKEAQEEIVILRSTASQAPQHDDQEQLAFQQKEARLIEASNEQHEMEMNRLRQEMQELNAQYETARIEEHRTFREEQDQMKSLLMEANSTIQTLEMQNQEMVNSLEKTQSNQEHQHVRALRKVEDRLAQSLATVDERDERITQLQKTIKGLESRISTDRDGAAEAEEEMDELHQENEVLHGQIEDFQAENDVLRTRLSAMEQDADELVRMKMELRLLREEHNRVQTKAENVAASAESDTAQLAQDRDEAIAEANDLQLRLSAAFADLDIAKADSERLVLSNENLQGALEAFQTEREAEMAMIEQQKLEEKQALDSAHSAEIDALKLVHQNEVRQIQKAADDAVRNTMEEVKDLEEKLEKFRMENVQTRRALDEAIERLSQTQDDVVDRTVMKNILLDWLTKAGKKERNQVLEMMADLLHFTDDEKRRVHIDGRSPSIRNIMSPPPAKVDVKTLEGDNVREKWVNFLLAETSDDL